jgi:hypothetical protein
MKKNISPVSFLVYTILLSFLYNNISAQVGPSNFANKIINTSRYGVWKAISSELHYQDSDKKSGKLQNIVVKIDDMKDYPIVIIDKDACTFNGKLVDGIGIGSNYDDYKKNPDIYKRNPGSSCTPLLSKSYYSFSQKCDRDFDNLGYNGSFDLIAEDNNTKLDNPCGKKFFNCGTGQLLEIDPDREGGVGYFITQYKLIESFNSETEYTIKSTASPKEINPDGKSTAVLETNLYEYSPGNENSSKPISNKKITFRIEQQNGITPGKLSSYEAVTDANGKVNVVFTAPDANLINNKNILSSSVVVRCDELGIEDIAYFNFTFDKGSVTVEPNVKGVVSKYGIVPPDKRYPAKVHAYLEDANGHKKANSKVTFTLSGNPTYGLLKTPDGQTGKTVITTSDANGNADVEYFFNSDSPPDKQAMETIDIKSEDMSSTMKGYIYIGLDLSIDKVENGYEGKGIVNAGEEIPLHIKIKDSRYPELDLTQVLTYWNGLNIKLEIKPLGDVPVYFLDKLKLQKYPQPAFEEIVDVKSFKDKGIFNILYVKESSLYKQKGYPCIKPTIPGQTNYEVKVNLADNSGQPLFISENGTNTSVISIKTGLPADAFSIFFIENPFGEHTDQAIFFRKILDLAGYGTIIEVSDIVTQINKGDYTGIVGKMIGELKDNMLGKLGEKIEIPKELAETYSEITFAEEIASLAGIEGFFSSMEDAFLEKLTSVATFGTSRMIVLHGNGNQQLIDGKTNTPIPVFENSLTKDDKFNTISVKHGNVSVYLVPADLDFKFENSSKQIIKGKTNGTKDKTEKEKPKEKEKTKEKKSSLFAGSWETGEFGTVTFIITGDKVVGTCSKNLGGITGKLSSDGTKITGAWARFPTYSSPNDAGNLVITVSADGKSFSGMFSKSTDDKAKLSNTLNGKKK